MQIRKLKPDDRPVLESILRSDSTFREDEIAVALELVDEALQAQAAREPITGTQAQADCDYWFRIAECDGEAAGYLCFGPTPMTECTYDLYWIVTHAQHRGKKVARHLVSHMEEALLARGPKAQVRVETSQSEGYGAARRLYERLGYPEVARFADFYKPGDDLIVFFKSLCSGPS